VHEALLARDMLGGSAVNLVVVVLILIAAILGQLVLLGVLDLLNRS
jgi:hypothetical protein